MTPSPVPQPALFGPAATPDLRAPQPVRVEAPPATHRVRVVIPCFNRPRDLELLLADLCTLQTDADLAVLVVDNASTPPLKPIADAFADRLTIDTLTLTTNTGGAGGFNAGMTHWLNTLATPGTPDLGAGEGPDRVTPTTFLWLLDSDARIEAATLRPLLAALDADPTLAIAGSALHDPHTRQLFELGGEINPRTGEYDQPLPASTPAGPRRVQYVAACSMLIRAHALATTRRALGLMPDIFLNGDDIALCLRVHRATGLHIAAVPESRAFHPTPDRPRTIARYYAARNALHVLTLAGAPRRARLARALRETARALGQALIGRTDLAELHLQGLRDALAESTNQRPTATLATPDTDLAATLARHVTPRSRIALRDDADLANHPAVADLLGTHSVSHLPPATNDRPRLLGLLRPPFDLALTTGRGRLADARLARTIISDAAPGFVTRKPASLLTTARLALRGTLLATRWALHTPTTQTPTKAQCASDAPDAPLHTPDANNTPSPTTTISTIILTYNRPQALEATLRALLIREHHQLLVIDNGSTPRPDPIAFRTKFPGAELVPLTHNRGVDAFNHGVKRATGELVLILDDDAIPEPGAVEAAAQLLAARPDLAAVTLHPRHPQTKLSEWPFGEHLTDLTAREPRLAGIENRWPVMGCANLVRKSAWLAVGGYDPGFFLYRNDADLAMKLLAQAGAGGGGVAFRPDLVVWHDSPATLPGAPKSRRWLELASRNWVWLCRRHGRGLTPILMIAAYALTTLRHAGLNPRHHAALARGLTQGLLKSPPGLPYLNAAGPRQGRALKDLWLLRWTMRKNRTQSR